MPFRSVRHFTAGIQALFQVLILTTGNYGFFNFLTIALCVPLVDDSFWSWLWSDEEDEEDKEEDESEASNVPEPEPEPEPEGEVTPVEPGTAPPSSQLDAATRHLREHSCAIASGASRRLAFWLGLAALGWCLGGPDSPEATDDKASNAWSVFTAGVVIMVLEGVFQAAVLWVRNDTALAEDRAKTAADVHAALAWFEGNIVQNNAISWAFMLLVATFMALSAAAFATASVLQGLSLEGASTLETCQAVNAPSATACADQGCKFVRWTAANRDVPAACIPYTYSWVQAQCGGLAPPPPPPPPPPPRSDAYADGGATILPTSDVLDASIDASHVTYRFSVAMPRGSSAKSAYTIFGDATSDLVIPPAYQCPTPFGANVGGTNEAFWPVANSANTGFAQYDSWLTVGVTGGDSQQALSSIGIDFDSWTERSGIDADNGAVFWMQPDNAPQGETVVAQLTVPSGASGVLRMGLQGRSFVAPGIHNANTDWKIENVMWGFGGAVPSRPENSPSSPSLPPAPPPGVPCRERLTKFACDWKDSCTWTAEHGRCCDGDSLGCLGGFWHDPHATSWGDQSTCANADGEYIGPWPAANHGKEWEDFKAACQAIIFVLIACHVVDATPIISRVVFWWAALYLLSAFWWMFTARTVAHQAGIGCAMICTACFLWVPSLDPLFSAAAGALRRLRKTKAQPSASDEAPAEEQQPGARRRCLLWLASAPYGAIIPRTLIFVVGVSLLFSAIGSDSAAKMAISFRPTDVVEVTQLLVPRVVALFMALIGVAVVWQLFGFVNVDLGGFVASHSRGDQSDATDEDASPAESTEDGFAAALDNEEKAPVARNWLKWANVAAVCVWQLALVYAQLVFVLNAGTAADEYGDSSTCNHCVCDGGQGRDPWTVKMRNRNTEYYKIAWPLSNTSSFGVPNTTVVCKPLTEVPVAHCSWHAEECQMIAGQASDMSGWSTLELLMVMVIAACHQMHPRVQTLAADAKRKFPAALLAFEWWPQVFSWSLRLLSTYLWVKTMVLFMASVGWPAPYIDAYLRQLKDECETAEDLGGLIQCNYSLAARVFSTAAGAALFSRAVALSLLRATPPSESAASSDAGWAKAVRRFSQTLLGILGLTLGIGLVYLIAPGMPMIMRRRMGWQSWRTQSDIERVWFNSSMVDAAGESNLLLGMQGSVSMTSEWSLASGYGLFASMTGVDRDTGDVARPELSIESCGAGFDGPQEYEFKYKPTAINRSLPVVSFPRMGQLMPRLDWQMWFQALYPTWTAGSWFARVLSRIRQGSRPVVDLIGDGAPYMRDGSSSPPSCLYVKKWAYEFSDFSSPKETWWRRREPSEFSPKLGDSRDGDGKEWLADRGQWAVTGRIHKPNLDIGEDFAYEAESPSESWFRERADALSNLACGLAVVALLWNCGALPLEVIPPTILLPLSASAALAVAAALLSSITASLAASAAAVATGAVVSRHEVFAGAQQEHLASGAAAVLAIVLASTIAFAMVGAGFVFIPFATVAGLGLATSIYMLRVEHKQKKMDDFVPVCDLNAIVTCSAPAAHRFGHIAFGVPNALLGCVFYVGVISLSGLFALTGWFWLLLVGYGGAMTSVAASVYLMMLCHSVLRKICECSNGRLGL